MNKKKFFLKTLITMSIKIISKVLPCSSKGTVAFPRGLEGFSTRFQFLRYAHAGSKKTIIEY